MAWLPGTSVTVEPAGSDMVRWAVGGIIRSSVATRYQLGLVLQAGAVIVPVSASTPQGTWELAMNAAVSASTSAAKAKWNFAGSRKRKPSFAGRIGGMGTPGDGSLLYGYASSR